MRKNPRRCGLLHTQLELLHVSDETRQPGLLGREDLPAARGQAVVSASPRVGLALGRGGFNHEPVVDQPAQVAIEGAGLERHAAARLLAYGLHYRVAVKVPFGERKQDVKRGGFERVKHVHFGYVHSITVQTDFPRRRLADINWNVMRLLRWIARSAGAALVGFHAWLLVSQLATGELSSDPALLFRWAAALALAGGLFWISREGNSLVSRRAVVLWLLAALLHGPAVAAQTGENVGLQTLPETAATLLIQTTAVAGVLVVALWLIAGLLRRRIAANAAWSSVSVPAACDFLDEGFGLVVCARPPPAR